MDDKWILVPLDANTNEVIAQGLADFCRAGETMQTPKGPGYIVPSDLYIDKDGIARPSVFLKKIESSTSKFNLKFAVYRVRGQGKPEKWVFSFISRGKKRQAVAKKIIKALKYF